MGRTDRQTDGRAATLNVGPRGGSSAHCECRPETQNGEEKKPTHVKSLYITRYQRICAISLRDWSMVARTSDRSIRQCDRTIVKYVDRARNELIFIKAHCGILHRYMRVPISDLILNSFFVKVDELQSEKRVFYLPHTLVAGCPQI